MFLDDCPAKVLREKYISIDEVEKVCGVTEEFCLELIRNKEIKYAEFKKPGKYMRSIFVNPSEIDEYLNLNALED